MSSDMERFKESEAMRLFGRSRKDIVDPKTGEIRPAPCVACGSDRTMPDDFRDDLSRKEYTLSKFCQTCQDETFGA